MSIISDIKKYNQRFGFFKTVITYLELALNRIIYFDCWNIITVPLDHIKAPENIDLSKLSCRFATYEDLQEMQTQNIWEIDDTKLNNFHDGDKCLLSYADSRLAGYTWIHIQNKPLLQPGLRLKIPKQYIYNFAAFTLSDFRGRKLQPYRHYMLSKLINYDGKRHLLGYVKYTNWSSRQGQTKSGYRPIGRMYLFGLKNKYWISLSSELKKIGIKRIPV